MRYIRIILTTITLMIAAISVQASDKVIKFYLDADRTNHAQSAISIERGILTALDEVDNQVAGYKVEVVPLDHRGNVLRSKKNYQKFLADPKALAVFPGIHSPPLIINRDFINGNKALTMVAWAAGGPVTRHPSAENWVFRVSVDDTRAGGRIVDHAIDVKKCTSPHLLLESTPWGDSNLKSMTKRLAERGIYTFSTNRFGMSLKNVGSDILLKKVLRNNSDCILLVANAIEGAYIASAMQTLEAEKRIPIISHWGITGGKFIELLDDKAGSNIDLSFIQTCFSFNQNNLNPFQKAVLTRAINLFDDIQQARDITAPVGFIHGYDATRILLGAVKQAGLTGNIEQDRNAVRLALENLQQPIPGLVKTYTQPFGQFDPKTNTNAHEALGPEEYCMARYNKQGDIILDSGR